MATRTPRNWPAVFARGHFRYFVDLFRAIANWASATASSMADLTERHQARGNGSDGDGGLVGIGRLPEIFHGWLLKATLNRHCFTG